MQNIEIAQRSKKRKWQQDAIYCKSHTSFCPCGETTAETLSGFIAHLDSRHYDATLNKLSCPYKDENKNTCTKTFSKASQLKNHLQRDHKCFFVKRNEKLKPFKVGAPHYIIPDNNLNDLLVVDAIKKNNFKLVARILQEKEVFNKSYFEIQKFLSQYFESNAKSLFNEEALVNCNFKSFKQNLKLNKNLDC